MHRISTDCTRAIGRCVLTALAVVLLLSGAAAAPPDALLLRLFLADGGSVVSYGEYARVYGRVVFSTPMGGHPAAPRLQVVSLPEDAIDWPRTERYGASARRQRYANTRGPADFEHLERDVAAVLNQIAVSTEPARARQIAKQAQAALADWSSAHYGYRADDVRDILMIVDEAVGTLRALAGEGDFALAFAAEPPDVPHEPMLGMPTLSEQVDHAFTIADLTERADDRVAVLEAALVILDEIDAEMPAGEVAAARATARWRIAHERGLDAEYAALTRRVLDAAAEAARAARVAEVQGLLERIPAEDVELGGERPYMIRALQTSVRAQLDVARRERLLLDQWEIRKTLHERYQQMAGRLIQNLVDMQPSIDAIRRLDGPTPDLLLDLRRQLRGGAERMELMLATGDLQQSHDLFIGAWRFAENAVNRRYEAADSGSVETAWEASSAAAGALSLLARAQEELQALLEPPSSQ